MIVLGIDLAARDEKVGLCRVRWRENGALAESVEVGAGDDRIVDLARDADVVAIDSPIGWPDDFVDAVSSYQRGEAWPGVDARQLRFRKTDLETQAFTGWWPLSVSSDLIGVTAMRAAHLLTRFEREGWPCPRDGSAKVLEVYPAAALFAWGLPSRGYKGRRGHDPRVRIAGALDACGVEINDQGRDLLLENDNALDAFVSALVGRAHAMGLCRSIPEEHRDRAKREGWIAIPKRNALSLLGGS